MTYVNFGSVTAVGILFPVLIIVVLAFRVHLRLRHSDKAGIEDVFLGIAALIDIAAGVGVTIAAQLHFLGDHSPVVQFDQFDQSTEQTQDNLLKLEYGIYISHYLAVWMTKLSILFFFRRIFKGRAYRTAFDYCNWTLIVLVTLWAIAMTFTQIFECGTVFAGNWSSLASLTGKCVKTFDLNVASSTLNFAMDVAILVEPLIMVIQMRMNRETKVQIALGFLLATFTVGVALIRMIFWIILSNVNLAHPPKMVLGLSGEDTDGVISLFIFWSYVEMGVGCLVAGLLPCRRYFRTVYVSPVVSSVRRLLTRDSNSTRNSSVAKDLHGFEMRRGPSRPVKDPLAISDFELESRNKSQESQPHSSDGDAERQDTK